MTTYKLDAKKAKEGDKGGNLRITETGSYVGVFTVAKAIKARTGTKGMEFSFKAENGASCRFLTLYLEKEDGEQLLDYNKLNAIMACMKVRGTTEKMMPVTEYDFNTKSDATTQEACYPELMNKPIGLVLQKEEYIKSDSSIGSKLNIYAAFNAETRQTAIEILENLPSEKLEKIEVVLKDKKVNKGDHYQAEQNATAATDNEFDDDFDEIPF